MHGQAASPETVSRDQVATIAAAIICITVVGVGLSLSSPLIALQLASRGVSATMIGFNTAMASLATLVIGPLVPALARALGVRLVVLGALSIGGGALALFAVFDGLLAWFILRFVYGAAVGTLFVLSEFWINAASPPRRRGMIMGIYATALSLGFAAGPAIIVLAGGAEMILFGVGALFFVAASAPILFAGRSAPALEGQTRRTAWGLITLAPAATLAGFVFGAIEQGSFAFLGLYGERVGLTTSGAALLLTLFGLGNVVSQLPLGLLSDRIDRRLLLLSCAAIGLAGALAMPVVAPWPAVLMVVVFVTGGVVGGLYTVGLAHLGARFTGSELATANAAFVMLYSLGMLAGAPAIGVAVDAIDPHGFPLAFAALCLAYCALVAWRLVRRRAV
jgi:MFS family permease